VACTRVNVIAIRCWKFAHGSSLSKHANAWETVVL
jgi:hypothetical protein